LDPARVEEFPKEGTGDDAGAGDASAVNELAKDMVVVWSQEGLTMISIGIGDEEFIFFFLNHDISIIPEHKL
jgi:hypothetical protein